MVSMARAFLSKSDQLNALDLIESKVIQIDRVDYDEDRKQKVWVFYNKLPNPWKPSLGILKIIGAPSLMGDDNDDWINKRLRIFNNPKVTWAGKESGGIQVSEICLAKRKMMFKLRINKLSSKPYEINPLVLSEKEITFFENLYGAGDENINSTNSTVNVKEEPETPLYLDATQIDIIQSLLDTAKWDIADFCGVMDVGALSEIGAVKFDNLRTKLNDKIATQYKENT